MRNLAGKLGMSVRRDSDYSRSGRSATGASAICVRRGAGVEATAAVSDALPARNLMPKEGGDEAGKGIDAIMSLVGP
jgi:hypothetical protein